MNAPDCICSPGRLPLGAFCAGRDDLEREALHDDRISIRAPRAGCDFFGFRILPAPLFQSTRPVWGATLARSVASVAPHHFNPRAPCGARRLEKQRARRMGRISIHAPRVGRDTVFCPPPRLRPISIHAPRVGRDGCYVSKDGDSNHFNPRAPCGARPRGGADVIATSRISIHAPRVSEPGQPWLSRRSTHNFNPRAPCGARHFLRYDNSKEIG